MKHLLHQKRDRHSEVGAYLFFGTSHAHRTQHLAQSATVLGFETLPRCLVSRPCGRGKFPYEWALRSGCLSLFWYFARSSNTAPSAKRDGAWVRDIASLSRVETLWARQIPVRVGTRDFHFYATQTCGGTSTRLDGELLTFEVNYAIINSPINKNLLKGVLD